MGLHIKCGRDPDPVPRSVPKTLFSKEDPVQSAPKSKPGDMTTKPRKKSHTIVGKRSGSEISKFFSLTLSFLSLSSVQPIAIAKDNNQTQNHTRVVVGRENVLWVCWEDSHFSYCHRHPPPLDFRNTYYICRYFKNPDPGRMAKVKRRTKEIYYLIPFLPSEVRQKNYRMVTYFIIIIIITII